MERCEQQAPGCYEEGQWKFDEIVVLLWLTSRRRQDRQGSERWLVRFEIWEASCEVERDEKEIEGVGHVEDDEVDDLEVQLD